MGDIKMEVWLGGVSPVAGNNHRRTAGGFTGPAAGLQYTERNCRVSGI
ncbi:hypothetical protein Hanom_Chr01g00022101 [Helianthus anomalus]